MRLNRRQLLGRRRLWPVGAAVLNEPGKVGNDAKRKQNPGNASRDWALRTRA